EPAHVGQDEVEQDDVRVVVRGEADPLGAGRRVVDRPRRGAEGQLDELADRGAVVDDEEMAHQRTPATNAKMLECAARYFATAGAPFAIERARSRAGRTASEAPRTTSPLCARKKSNGGVPARAASARS